MTEREVTERDLTERDLTERIAIITGGGRGIGREAAFGLSADGWTVVVAGRTASDLDTTVAALDGPGLAVVTDVADEMQVEALFDRTVAEFGRVDLLFNNAGIFTAAAPPDEITVEDWDRVVAINLRGAFLCARAAFARMRAQTPSGGRIINNGSVSATTPRRHSAPYTATKHAITGLTKSFALDGRSLGITCGQIDIGNVESEIGDRIADGALQADGSVAPEPVMGADAVTRAIVYMASLPPDANVLNLTVMANGMPFVGRG